MGLIQWVEGHYIDKNHNKIPLDRLQPGSKVEKCVTIVDEFITRMKNVETH